MRTMRGLFCLLAGLVLLLVSCSRPAGPGLAVPVPKQPQTSLPVKQLGDPERAFVAGPVDPDPRVGAVFFGGGTRHSCTASVVHSTGGDLVLTAAHCLSGGLQAGFVPGFAGDTADMWALHEVYFDPRWLTGKDPHADYAIARVSGPGGGALEAHVGLRPVTGRGTRRGQPYQRHRVSGRRRWPARRVPDPHHHDRQRVSLIDV